MQFALKGDYVVMMETMEREVQTFRKLRSLYYVYSINYCAQ